MLDLVGAAIGEVLWYGQRMINYLFNTQLGMYHIAPIMVFGIGLSVIFIAIKIIKHSVN